MLLRLISSLLIVTTITGCASRTVYFFSTPPGAVVSAGSPLCTTPCETSLPKNVQKVLFTLPSGKSKEVDVTHINRGTDTRFSVARTGEFIFGTLAFPLLIVGGAGALVTGLLYKTDAIETTHSSRDEDVAFIAGGVLLAGGGLFYVSKEMAEDARDSKPVINVDF